MGKIKIAIIGSCVSRDNFNSMFIPNYKRYYDCVFHQNQMSMISLMSNPIPYDISEVDGKLSAFDKRQFETELDKTALTNLLINQPDFLILDFFADSLMGVKEFGNSYITNKHLKFSETTLYKNNSKGNEITLSKSPENYFNLWKESVNSFFKFMNSQLPQCKIIINQARFTDEYIDKSTGNKEKINNKIYPIDTDFCNKWWKIFDEYIIQKFDVERISYDKKYFSVETHPWGMYHVHYQKEYYFDFTSKLLEILINGLKQKLDRVNNIQSNISNLQNLNLISNADFKNGKSFWSEWNSDFKIENDNIVGNKIVHINRGLLEKNKIASLWSNLIEIHSDAKKVFLLSFDMRVDDLTKFDEYQVFFAVRTFNKTNQYSQRDAIWYRYFDLSNISIKENEWTHLEFQIKPFDGKYLRLGPYIFKNGSVSWKNLKFSIVSL
ncbi:DUF6270 domain-containing protein [Weissella paramesenteroides]|uniref:DUF6270 domain-containing protein n=1 Tax=Weissella paramesenteroides TaxID=1249 RepID=UPI00123B6E76|nr:DUF6270 domain-containing protein [Weissella paramesenteroides]KAA8446797.1 hypothetical protein FKV72_03130 [Weissella paramesenteroides]KAA8454309.1 hypothetical protein FKV71_00650 [Weissella paramesenteroides]